MSVGTLYTYPGNFRAYKIQIAALYAGSDIKVISEAPEFVFGQTNKTDSFLQKFPLGKVPAFETADNQYLFESDAIAYYVSNSALKGNNTFDQAQVNQWVSFAQNELLPQTSSLVLPALGAIRYIKPEVEKAKEELKALLQFLNKHLLTRTFLVGERVTLADIAIVSTLLPAFQHVLEPTFRDAFTNLIRYFNTVINQPHFKTVLGQVNLLDKEVTFEAPKKAPKAPKANAAPEEKKPAKEKKPKKVEEEPQEELDEADLILAQEQKSKDPFEDFPKGTFVMDNFKRVYSNESEEVSIKYFWENFDKENYSIWYGEYKFPKELSIVFMSCNLIGGMFQRLDKMRKHAFGSAILFGEDNDSTISGIWVWRGHDLAFKLSDNWQVDYESYEWKKLNPDDAETKKTVNEYLSWTGDFGGKKFNQGKIFK